MDSDLEVLIRDRATIMSPADVKSYMQMVLQSLLACKQHWVLHRDIKPSNFLVSAQGMSLIIVAALIAQLLGQCRQSSKACVAYLIPLKPTGKHSGCCGMHL